MRQAKTLHIILETITPGFPPAFPPSSFPNLQICLDVQTGWTSTNVLWIRHWWMLQHMCQTDACVLIRWQHFSAWNDVILKLSCRVRNLTVNWCAFSWRTILPSSSRSNLKQRRGCPNKSNIELDRYPPLFVYTGYGDMQFCVLFDCSQLAVNAVDGLKLKNRATRFANTLGSSESPNVRMEPLTLTRQNVSLIIVLSFSVVRI